jgi:hypothetical protein
MISRSWVDGPSRKPSNARGAQVTFLPSFFCVSGRIVTNKLRLPHKGTINISTRGLPCIPSALFEIHLGITPDPLKSVVKEPPISTGTENPAAPQRRKGGGGRDAPAWFEAQDLQILKAWSNEIVEIQPEISLFGSIKTLDVCIFHNFIQTSSLTKDASCFRTGSYTTTRSSLCPTR